MLKLAGVVCINLLLALGAIVPLHAETAMDGTRTFARGNYIAAAKTTIPLARRGDARAQALLGFMYEHGRGVAQNFGLAVHWYNCAAEQGHPTAQYLLGLMYDKGRGVERSDTLAYMWLSLAAAHAPPHAQEYYLRIRNAIAGKLSAEKVAKAQWLAAQFVPINRRRSW